MLVTTLVIGGTNPLAHSSLADFIGKTVLFRGDTFGGTDSVGAKGSSPTLEVGAAGFQGHVAALERITSHARRT